MITQYTNQYQQTQVMTSSRVQIVVLLYDAAGGAVYGKVYQAGRTTLLGNPPPPLADELDKLWRQEWRGGRGLLH